MPPNGTRGSEATTALTNTAPASTRRASAVPRAISAVQIDAPRPKAVRLASATAASASAARTIAEIGRASWRERVCTYVEISVVAVTLKQKKHNIHITNTIFLYDIQTKIN